MNRPNDAPRAVRAPSRRGRTRATLAVALACVLALAVPACAPATPPDPTIPATALLQGRYGTRSISLEIADDLTEQTRGLMDRATLPPDHGMLFVYTEDSERTFWMHNTHVPLDMIFLDAHHNIVGIVRRAQPDRDDALTIGKPSRYVLEVEGGLCDRLGVREGDRIALR